MCPCQKHFWYGLRAPSKRWPSFRPNLHRPKWLKRCKNETETSKRNRKSKTSNTGLQQYKLIFTKRYTHYAAREPHCDEHAFRSYTEYSSCSRMSETRWRRGTYSIGRSASDANDRMNDMYGGGGSAAATAARQQWRWWAPAKASRRGGRDQASATTAPRDNDAAQIARVCTCACRALPDDEWRSYARVLYTWRTFPKSTEPPPTRSLSIGPHIPAEGHIPL